MFGIRGWLWNLGMILIFLCVYMCVCVCEKAFCRDRSKMHLGGV